MYIEDIDTPDFLYLKMPTVTNHFIMEPLKSAHFLDFFEFKLQKEYEEEEDEDMDPFDNLGERLEKAYVDFFDYTCNLDHLTWVILDRTYLCGFILLTMNVDYNDYMNRKAHLYYEITPHMDEKEYHMECIKSISDLLFANSDIPRLEMSLCENEKIDVNCIEAAKELGFTRGRDEGDGSRCYFLLNKDPALREPPRHMRYVLKAYKNQYKRKGRNRHPALN